MDHHFKSIGQMLRAGEIFLTELQELIPEEVDKQLIEVLRGK